VIIEDKAYMGGKTVHDKGGGLLDFLVANRLTSSAALVEIKTPDTDLVIRNYRDGIPNISPHLTGAVVQVLSYKTILSETYLSTRPTGYEMFDPPCTIIIGTTKELNTREKQRSFELFRRQLRGVEVVTFDELFGRVERLLEMLGLPGVGTKEEEQADDLPF
jgi:hypothetical protein